MNYSDMHEVAQGRVWTGQQAIDRKLVDQLGGFWKALEVAEQLLPKTTVSSLQQEVISFRKQFEKEKEQMEQSIINASNSTGRNFFKRFSMRLANRKFKKMEKKLQRLEKEFENEAVGTEAEAAVVDDEEQSGPSGFLARMSPFRLLRRTIKLISAKMTSKTKRRIQELRQLEKQKRQISIETINSSPTFRYRKFWSLLEEDMRVSSILSTLFPSLFSRKARSSSSSRTMTRGRPTIYAISSDELFFTGYADAKEFYGEFSDYCMKMGLNPFLFMQALPEQCQPLLKSLLPYFSSSSTQRKKTKYRLPSFFFFFFNVFFLLVACLILHWKKNYNLEMISVGS
jgi:DNA-binding protein YbaB